MGCARKGGVVTGRKTSKSGGGDVVIERVMSSDTFLSREIRKAPMRKTDSSLVADISHIPNDLKITIQGAREHNLKNVDLAVPRNRMVVFTGLSGSGKSSLAFDTLFAEGQRRYVESLSAYARQFLGQMDKPDVDFIEGLSPAVSIDQKTTNRNPRSTVGTITEIYDYLRLLFARTGVPHCPECGELVSAQTPQQMVDMLLKNPERTRFQILAPVVRGRKGEFADLLELLRGDGYARALIDGEERQLSDDIKLTKQKKHTIEVVVDRLMIRDGIRFDRDRAAAVQRCHRRRFRGLGREGPESASTVLGAQGLSERASAAVGRDRAPHVLVQCAIRGLPCVRWHRLQAGDRPRSGHRR